MIHRIGISLFCLLVSALALVGQSRIGTGEVKKLYGRHCAECHGVNLRGGIGGSLVEGEWDIVGREVSFLEYVKEGNEAAGMPAFGDKLSDKGIRSLRVYIDEMRQKFEREGTELVPEAGGTYKTDEHTFRMETVVKGLSTPWGMAFLPGGGILITERGGNLRLYEDEKLHAPVKGVPEVWARGQGGMLEVALHPDYEENGWVYLGFSENRVERDGRPVGTTKIVRGRIRGNEWVDGEIIYEVPSRYHRAAGAHFGTRIVFRDDYLFFSIGDRRKPEHAQDLKRPNGKIHRLHLDGEVPGDNPFTGETDAVESIWSYGHRNPQGLDFHPATGELWESEHGPRGGDEINRIEKGANYGWPEITHGINYNGTPITDKTEAPGMEQPVLHWTPSIAVCGIGFYTGDRFPEWRNNLLAGGLASRELHRLVIEDGEITKDEIILKDEGRIRDVATGPDGLPYVLLNAPDRMVRLVPAEAE